MRLTEVLNIKQNSVVSIVGAGGKTTLMFQLAKELKEKGRVLITTTTKIYVPEPGEYDYLIIGKERRNLYFNQEHGEKEGDLSSFRRLNKGIWVYGETINEENKLTSINDEKLRELVKEFDYVLIEADGSKGKPLKGWREDEPVISSFTDYTIGVLNGQTLGVKINEENIHRVGMFLGKATGRVNEEDLIKVIFEARGMFNHSKGKRILFVNHLDKEEIQKRNCDLLSEIINENKERNILDEVIGGSLKKNTYFRVNVGGTHG